MIDRLDERKDADTSPTQDDDQLMTLDDACRFLGKKRSTMYALTSERRIPFRKRGNKLYFFKKELVEWIECGGSYDAPYTFCEKDEARQAEFDAHLKQLRETKKNKPSATKPKTA